MIDLDRAIENFIYPDQGIITNDSIYPKSQRVKTIHLLVEYSACQKTKTSFLMGALKSKQKINGYCNNQSYTQCVRQQLPSSCSVLFPELFLLNAIGFAHISKIE